ARNPRSPQSFHRLVLGALLGPRLDERVELVIARDASHPIGERGVVAELRAPEDLREGLPHLEGRAVNEDVVVRPERAAAIHVRGRAPGRTIATPWHRLAGRVMLAKVDANQIEHGVLLSDLDALPDTRGLALDDRGQNTDREVESRARVAESSFDLRGRPISGARHALLVAVQHQKEPGADVGPLGQRPASRLAPRRLDLDDLGTKPAEHLCAAWPRLVLSEVQHHDPVERLRHAFPPVRVPAKRWAPFEVPGSRYAPSRAAR